MLMPYNRYEYTSQLGQTMAITLKDVASVAGVSTATVSRALAGSERVSPQTADHIKTIANDLGYRYDNVARALRQKRSNLVGMVVPNLSFCYGQELLFALNQQLFQSEYILAAVTSFGSVDHELIQVERLLGQRIDALLIMPAHPIDSTEAIDIALEEEVPVIQLFGQVQHAQTANFHLDYAAGLEFALRSLKQRAIRSIAYLNDPKAFAFQSKVNALQQVLTRYALDNFLIVSPGTRKHHSFESALEEMSRNQLPDLIICNSNEALRVVSKHVAVSAPAERPPVILCLDPIRSADVCSGISAVAIEFSMHTMARCILERINSALNGDAAQPCPARMQPFINLSNLRSQRIIERASLST